MSEMVVEDLCEEQREYKWFLLWNGEEKEIKFYDIERTLRALAFVDFKEFKIICKK